MNKRILVVGAGPTGLTLAAELARYGVSVRIIEKRDGGAPQSKAVIFWSRTLELLDRADASAAFLAAGHKVDGAHIVAAGHPIGDIDFGDVRSAYPYALMLPQTETERVLTAHLARFGVKVEHGTALESFTDGESGIAAVLRHEDGTEEAIEANWLVGCDGAHGTVADRLAIPYIAHESASAWLVADVSLSGVPYPPTHLVSYWHESGFLGLFPISPTRYRAIASLAVREGEELPPADLSKLQLLLDERGPGGIEATAPEWLTAFRIHERNARGYQSGHVFIAGDAAHLHSPAGGQGMNMGIHDAVNLAWKLALVCHGTIAADRLLPSYTEERQAVAERVLADVQRLTAISTTRSPTAQLMRNLLGTALFGLAPARRAIVDKLTEVTLGYENSSLNATDDRAFPGPGPGERMPPLPGQPPFGAGDRPRFTLLADPSPDVTALLARHADLLAPQAGPPVSPRCIWLVRPDGYVAATAMAPDLPQIAEYLDMLRLQA